MRPFSLRIFLPDGSPDGLRIIEKSNWTGLGVVCPRPLLSKAKQRDEFSKPGVYILWGPPEQGGLPSAYIGEAELIRKRLESHVAQKDFWTQVTFFVAKDGNLNKAHVQYLEARLVQLAQEAKRSHLQNGNVPHAPSLAEAEQADAEAFLEEMLVCLPVLGLHLFEKPEARAPGVESLRLSGKQAVAEGYESSDGFVVLAGGKARPDEVTSIHSYLTDLRNDLLQQGVFKSDPDHWTLQQDYVFSSPSTAAGVMLGRSANGRVEWKDAKGVSLKELQDASL